MEQDTLQYVFIVSQDGFIMGATMVDISKREQYPNEISTPFPSLVKLEKPKWNGTKWVEGETQEEMEERESQQLLESLKPSPSEIVDAELEIKLLTTLTELGVIQ